MSYLGRLLRTTTGVCQSVKTSFLGTSEAATRPISTTCVTQCSADHYDPNPNYDAPSPYRGQNMHRNEYKYKYYKGGVLPRPDKKEFKDKPLPSMKRRQKDAWSKDRALYGQNDYIDILGDGSVQPWELSKAPLHLRGFKGNELQRLIKKLNIERTYLRRVEPAKYLDIVKRIDFLYRRLNLTRHQTRWWAGGKSRFFRVKDWQ